MDPFGFIRYWGEASSPSSKRIKKLEAALEKIIEMNYQNADDQYGDRNKAEKWSCVVVAKKALEKP